MRSSDQGQGYDMNQPASSADIAELVKQLRAGVYPWWYPFRAMGLAVVPFSYTADFLPLSASASQNKVVNIDGDSAFFIRRLVLTERSVDNLVVFPNPPVLIDLKFSGAGAYLSDGPMDAPNWFGDASLPGIFEVPYILSPNSAFTVTAQNLEATDRNVRIAFQGIKVYSYQPTAS